MPDGRPTSDASSPVRSSSPPLRCVAPPVVTSAPFTDLSWVLHTLLVTIVMREALKVVEFDGKIDCLLGLVIAVCWLRMPEMS